MEHHLLSAMIIADCTQDYHGLGNRITILCSAYASARVTGQPMILAWLPGADCQAFWHDLFEPLEGIDISRTLPAGKRHLACAHVGGKHRQRHLASAGKKYSSALYWAAWRECAQKVRLIPELEAGIPSDHHAMHIRALYPGRGIPENHLNWCNPFEGSYLAADSLGIFNEAILRWPHIKFLHTPIATKDRGDCRGRDLVRNAAREMVMLSRAKSIIAIGGPSTFRNMAHIGYDVPLYYVYKGGSP